MTRFTIHWVIYPWCFVLLIYRCIYPWRRTTTEHLYLHIVPKRWWVKATTSHACPVFEHVMRNVPKECSATVLAEACCTWASTLCFVSVRWKLTWVNLHISLVEVHAYTECWSSSRLAISTVTRNSPSDFTSCWISYFATGTAAFMHSHVVFLLSWYTWWKHIMWEVKSKMSHSFSWYFDALVWKLAMLPAVTKVNQNHCWLHISLSPDCTWMPWRATSHRSSITSGSLFIWFEQALQTWCSQSALLLF